VSKNKSLRNIIMGAAIAIVIVCVAIPVYVRYFPYDAKASGSDPDDTPVTYVSVDSQNDPQTDPETDPPTEAVGPQAYVPPVTDSPTNPPPTNPPYIPPPVIPVTTLRPTTTKAPVTTKKPTTTKAPTTTKKPSETNQPSSGTPGNNPAMPGGGDGGSASWHTDGAVPAPYLGEDDPRAVLSYKMNANDGYFYTEQEAWQRRFGFCKAYDFGAQFIMMFYDTVRVRFNYGGYNWQVQMWKGQYGFMFVGSEVGVYYLPEKKNGNPPNNQAVYKCVPNDDMLNMSTALFFNGDFQAKRPYKKYWWCTTFVPGTLRKNTDRSQLRVEMVIEMKDSAMGDAFESSLIKEGFILSGNTYAECLKTGFDHSDVYARSGAKFAINWLLAGAPRPNKKMAY